MKTIRLLYPDYVSGGLETYFFGANLLRYILPENKNHPLIKVEINPPDGTEKIVTDGIYAKDEVLAGIKDAAEKIRAENPDKIITIGGNCIVSFAPFDYLHAIYKNVGVVWIDAHSDVSTINDGYPNAHAMVLGSLLGYGSKIISDMMTSEKFKPSEILYVGLQDIHSYQKSFLDKIGVDYKIQTETFVSDDEILKFVRQFDKILIHLDIDVLDEKFFHSTYFANKDLVGDGSSGGKMTIEKLAEVLNCIVENSEVVGFTVAEYLPFDEHRLNKLFSKIKIFTD